ncbi:zf-CCHC domain-containing protein [Tanacetum coccineum]
MNSLLSLKKESIDSGFARFNTIITSLKSLDEGFSSKNYVRKFLRALHPKRRANVTAIEESKDLSSLALDELIGNLKVHKVVMEKDFKIYNGKKERVKSIALKAKKESSDDETLTSGSDDEEYAMPVRNFKKFFRRKGKFVRQPREEKKSFRQRDEKKRKSDRKCFRCGDLNHLIGDCPKPPRNKDQKAFIGGSWSDSKNDAEDKTNDETCLMAQSSNEVIPNSSYYSDNGSSHDNDTMQIEYDSLCEISLKIINKNKILKTKRDLLEKEILELNEKIKKLERSKEIDITCKLCQELKLENARLKETQVKFVKFDKSANSLTEMLNNQKSSSCKIGLGFDSSNASTSGTKPISFVGSSAENTTDGSTIKVHGWIRESHMYASLKALDEESKDLSSLALDELIGKLKVHELVMKKDSEIYKGKKERVKSITLKDKKESSDDETSTSGSNDEEYAMAGYEKKERVTAMLSMRSSKISPWRLSKTISHKRSKAIIGGSCAIAENDAEDKTNDETCLMAQSSNEVTFNSYCYSDNAYSLDNDNMQIEYDSLCEISLKIINNNKILKNKRDLLETEILELNEKIRKLERGKEIEIPLISYVKNSKVKKKPT